MPPLLRGSIVLLGAVVVVAPLIHLVFESRPVDYEVWQHLRQNQIPSSLFETFIFSIGSAITAFVIGTSWTVLSLFLPRLNFIFKIA